MSDAGTATPVPKELPELPYSLRNHKISIIIIWTLLVLDSAIIPLLLFYPLWFGTSLDPSYIFVITTSLFGTISGAEWVYRTWKLLKHERLRPLKSPRYTFDFFHFAYTVGYGIGLIELIVGASQDIPIFRLCALPSASFILYFGIILLLFSTLHTLHIAAPIRISSVLAGHHLRPATYMILEDVISVDTGLGQTYRTAVGERYEASADFRLLLRNLDLFWGVPGLLLGVGIMAVVLDERVPQLVAYGIGWGIPPLWAALWAVITTKWVQRALRREKDAWAANLEKECGERV